MSDIEIAQKAKKKRIPMGIIKPSCLWITSKV